MNLFLSFLYFFIGVIPCILWLIFYLRQDVHPESNKKVIEIFLWGVVIVVPVVVVEKFLEIFFPTEDILFQNLPLLFLYYIVGVGFVEEFSKYFIVRSRVINSSEFDEPIDAILYLIIAGLGFATVENIIVIFNVGTLEGLKGAAIVSLIRPFTAIFIHTLAAGITGYFLALSLHQKPEKRGILVLSGLLLSSIFHGVYDAFMLQLEENPSLFSLLLPFAIIVLVGVLVYIFFIKVKKMPRTCRI
ncbi:PrsW family intramembrane metalloprotease [bacterium]|nr:PrsW family intramembrane metalloprotease [bacterium]